MILIQFAGALVVTMTYHDYGKICIYAMSCLWIGSIVYTVGYPPLWGPLGHTISSRSPDPLVQHPLSNFTRFCEFCDSVKGLTINVTRPQPFLAQFHRTLSGFRFKVTWYLSQFACGTSFLVKLEDLGTHVGSDDIASSPPGV